jgi:hypothetical protein
MDTLFTQFRTGTSDRPKTVGVLFDLTDTGFNNLEAWSSGEALTIYKLASKFVNDQHAAAKGKVIFINRAAAMPEAVCFQANGEKAEPAWCGNAYAAVAAYLHQRSLPTNFVVHNNEKLTVKADVSMHNEDFTVAQKWQLQRQYILNDPGPGANPSTIFLRFLNDYRVIITTLSEQFDEQMEMFASRLNALRLTEKICLLNPHTGKVVFFTASYIHGGAPVTGLCSLSLLKYKVGWLGQGVFPDCVQTPSGEEMLPKLRMTGSSIFIDINSINVNLQRL